MHPYRVQPPLLLIGLSVPLSWFDNEMTSGHVGCISSIKLFPEAEHTELGNLSDQWVIYQYQHF